MTDRCPPHHPLLPVANCSLDILPHRSTPPRYPLVIPTILLCAQRAASYHAAAPFFVLPCCRCSSIPPPVPLVLLPSSRKGENGSGAGGTGGGGRVEVGKSGVVEGKEDPSTPRRSFCFSPGDFGEFSRRRYYGPTLLFLLSLHL